MKSPYIQTALFVMNRPEPIRQTSLLMVLASGVGNGDALIDGLQAHAHSCRSPWADQVMSLRLLLEQGLTLSSALSGFSGMLPEQTLHAIRVGEATGTLREVLFDEAARLADPGNDEAPIGLNFSGTLLWFNVIGVTMAFVVTFVMVFIIPKFKKIFEDFDTELPQLTQSVIGISDLAVSNALLLLPPLLGTLIGGSVLAVWASYQSVSKGRTILLEHWPSFWVPDLLRVLSLAAASGHSFGVALHAIQQELRPGWAARVFSSLRHKIESGEDCIQSMNRLGLLNVREAAFLQASQRNGHLDWGFRHLAREVERTRNRWARRLLAMLEPAMILLIGVVVMAVVVGLFLPIIKLINDLS